MTFSAHRRYHTTKFPRINDKLDYFGETKENGYVFLLLLFLGVTRSSQELMGVNGRMSLIPYTGSFLD